MNSSAPVKITDLHHIYFCYVHVPRSVDLYLQQFANKKKSLELITRQTGHILVGSNTNM